MTKTILYLTCLLSLFIPHLVYAQCATPNNVTLTTTNITCRASGVISITAVSDAAGSVPLSECIFSLWNSGNTTQVKPEQSSPNFIGLDPGTYTLRTKHVCSGGAGISAEYTKSVTITGSYADPVISTTPKATSTICGNDGTINLGVNKGYGDLTFCLIDQINADTTGGHLLAPSKKVIRSGTGIVSYRLTDLTPGTYYIRVYDACDGFVTYSTPIVIGTNTPAQLGVLSYKYLKCDTVGVNFRIDNCGDDPDGIYPLSVGWISYNGYTDSLKVLSQCSINGFSVALAKIGSLPATVTVGFKNKCGTITTNTITINPEPTLHTVNISQNPIDCNTGVYTYSSTASPLKDALNNNYAYDSISIDGGVTWLPPSTSLTLPAGTTTTTTIKRCGTTYTFNIVIATLPALNMPLVEVAELSCPGKASIRAANGFYAYGSTLVHVVSKPPTQPDIPDFYTTFSGGKVLYNVMPGTYTLGFTDGCGRYKESTITLVGAGTTSYSITAQVTSCSASGTITVTRNNTRSSPGDMFITLYDTTKANKFGTPNDLIFISSTSPKTVGMPVGTYRILVSPGDSTPYYKSACPYIDTVTIPAIRPLTLAKGLASVCTNDPSAGAIAAIPSGGQAPYTYALFKGTTTLPVNQVGLSQSSNLFSNLDVNAVYTVQVKDQCGSGSTFTASVSNTSPVINPSTLFQPCIGNPITLSVSKSPNVSYQWSLNDVDVSGATDTAYKIASMTRADSGTYKVRLQINECQITSSGMTLDPEKCGQILPLRLLSFAAQRQKNTVMLYWQADQQINTSQFEIEHSVDGVHWQKLGSQKAAGNYASVLSYNYTHANPAASINYYRLKLVDMDGSYTYSKTVADNMQAGVKNINIQQLYPVPFNGQLNVQIYSSKSKPAIFTLYDIHGKKVLEKHLLLQKGTAIYTLQNLETVPAGSYVLQLQTDEEVLIEKVIKQRLK